jgi:hypothetical protein
MYFCGYFALPNGPNWEVIYIIPIFWVIFGQNLCIWPPRVTMYGVTPYCLAIHFEEILSCFLLNVFLGLLCIIKWSKLGSNWHNTNIWGHFWSQFGYLTTPRGDDVWGTPYCLAINFEEIPSCFVLNAFLWLLCIINWSKLISYWHNTNILAIFGQNLGIWPPGVITYRVTP